MVAELPRRSRLCGAFGRVGLYGFPLGADWGTMVSMEFSGAGKTDVGQARGHNEDFFICDQERGLFVVCDGMGGHASGEVASRLAAETIQREIIARASEIEAAVANQDSPALERLLRVSIEIASRKVFDEGATQTGRHGMGTTCVAILAREGRIHVGHVGDSRVYMCRAGTAWQLTDDHTYLNDAVKAGWMTQQEAEKSPHAHMITRGVGVQASVKVDTLTVDVAEGDRFLLCSDGLHSYTEDLAELADLMQPETLEQGTEVLVDLANQRGGSDNITALLVASEPLGGAGRSQRSLTIDSDLRALRHLSLFVDLEMRELMRLGGLLKAETYEAGAVLVNEGARDDSCFILVEGRVDIRKGKSVVATLSKGTHFGEMALLSRQPRTATVSAASKVRVLRLERKAFMNLVRTEPSIAVKCLWKIAQSLATRLDDEKLIAPAPDMQSAASKSGTRELEILSPFRLRG